METLSVSFFSSAAGIGQCPAPKLPEYAFLGRSNVGKSSLINMLAGTKGLARISTTPGKTQLINHFLVEDQWFLVDLPGYGYARASRQSRTGWNKMVNEYLMNRENLMCSFILIDIRHEMQSSDADMIRWFGKHQLPLGIIFTKADKLNQNLKAVRVKQYREFLLNEWEELPPHWVTSSITGQGREEVLQYIREVNQMFVKN